MQEHVHTHHSTHTHTHVLCLFLVIDTTEKIQLFIIFIRVAPSWKHGLLKPCEDIFAQAGKMALRLRAHSVLQKTSVSVLSTHFGQLETTCDSRSGLCEHPHVYMHTTTNEQRRYTYVQNKCYLPIHSIPYFLELYPNERSSAGLSILLCKPEANSEIGKHVFKGAFWELIWLKEQWVDISTLKRERLCV